MFAQLRFVAIEVCNKYLQSHKTLDVRSFKRVHCIGKLVSNKQTPIVERIVNYKDKLAILRIRKNLHQEEKINILDDFTHEVEEHRHKLYPVMMAIKARMTMDDKGKVFLKEDKLSISVSIAPVPPKG